MIDADDADLAHDTDDADDADNADKTALAADDADECNQVPDVYSPPELPMGAEMIIADNHTSLRQISEARADKNLKDWTN